MNYSYFKLCKKMSCTNRFHFIKKFWFLISFKSYFCLKEYIAMQSFITLCFGSIRNDRVISEPCYEMTLSQTNYRKTTIKFLCKGQR